MRLQVKCDSAPLKQLRPARSAVVACLMIAILGSVGCDYLNRHQIVDLQKKQNQYLGREVAVQGRVKDTTNLFVTKFYVLKDDTGEIEVFTSEPLPGVGAEVVVTGVLDCKVPGNGNCSFLSIKESKRKYL